MKIWDITGIVHIDVFSNGITGYFMKKDRYLEKTWMYLEIISKVMLLVSFGFQFLIIQPINDEFQKIQQKKIEDTISKSAERFQYLSKKIDDINKLEIVDKTNSEEVIEFTEEDFKFAVKSIAEFKNCSVSVIGNERVSEIYTIIPELLSSSNISEVASDVIGKVSEAEFDQLLSCLIEPYINAAGESLGEAIGDVMIEATEMILAPVIEELIIEPILVKYAQIATWLNFLLFLFGSILAVTARIKELKVIN